MVIRNLEIDVEVKSLDMKKIDKLTIPAQNIKGTRNKPNHHVIEDFDFTMEAPEFVMTSIKGHAKWKRGPGVVLKLKFYKKDNDRHDAELKIAKTAADKPDDDYVVTPINFEYDPERDYCKPRHPGWSRMRSDAIQFRRDSILLFTSSHSFDTPLHR